MGEVKRIPLTRPYFRGDEWREIQRVIESGWVTQGRVTEEFERSVAEWVGASHAVATSSCTTALHLALEVAGVGAGDEVVCPSLSFIATANAIRHVGAEPVFADVDPSTANLDPHAAEAAVTERTRAIMPVHQLGCPADLRAFTAIAERRGVALVEDAACALGAAVDGERVGARSRFACFSFHPRKVITTGEGGIVLTTDADAAERIRSLRNHGMSISDAERHRADEVIVESYPEVGYNFRLTDIQAALGIAQLRVLDECLTQRRALAARYSESLADVATVPSDPPGMVQTFQSYMIRLTGRSANQRDELMRRLLEDGIATRRGVMASHLETPYRTRPWDLPVTEEIARTGLLLPLYPDMAESDQDHVVARVRSHLADFERT